MADSEFPPGDEVGDDAESQTRSYPQSFFVPAPDASQLVLVRHGQSAPYVSGRPFPLIDGHGDPPLTELGHFQAELVANRLKSEPISSIYVSTLTRTHQTAAPLAKALDLEPLVEPDIREVFLGEGEGGHLREMFANNHPLAQQIRATGEWGVIPGAESNAIFTERTVGAVSRIAERHRDEMVAVFCHGGVIAAVLAHAANTRLRSFAGVRHTSINHLIIQRWDDAAHDEWLVRSFNDGAHAGHLTGDHLPGQVFPATHQPATNRE